MIPCVMSIVRVSRFSVFCAEGFESVEYDEENHLKMMFSTILSKASGFVGVKNQLVQHRGECLLQRIVFYKSMWHLSLCFDMGVAACIRQYCDQCGYESSA